MLQTHTLSLAGLYIGALRPLPEGQLSGIFKTPVTDKVELTTLGLVGDQQADPRVHGGRDKALHHYPADHYAYWQNLFPEQYEDFIPGSFGENLSTLGWQEGDVCIGDQFRLGHAVIELTQPRRPCWKLNHRFDIGELSLRVQNSRRTGWYYRVLETGALQVGDQVQLLHRPAVEVSVADLWAACLAHPPQLEPLLQVARANLTDGWRRIVTDKIAWCQKVVAKPA